MTAPDAWRGLRVAVDVRPLLNLQTGVANFCRGAIAALAEQDGLEIGGYAVTWRRQREIPALLPAGVKWRVRPMPARPIEAAWSRWRHPTLEWFVGAIDVVHGTNFVVPPTSRAARVLTVHDLSAMHFPELCEPPTLRFPDLARRAIRDGAWVHTHSQFVADEVVEFLGAPPKRVRVVPPGIPVLDAPAQVPDRGLIPPEPYLLAIGTVEPRKDYPTLVRAFDLLAADHPDVRLVICGADGWGAPALDQALAELRFHDRVLRPGYRTDIQLAALLEHAQALVYPSKYEGFGFPPLQAMRAGIPVIATAAGAVPEVVGSAAVLVPPGDLDGLAGALASVLDDCQYAEELRRAGREHAAKYTWDACAAGLAELYRATRQGVG